MLFEYGFELKEEEASINLEQDFVEAMMLQDEAHKSTELILLSMYDAEDSTTKDVIKARNRACAQQARDADKLFIELMQAELTEIIETFELYTTYTTHLSMHAPRDAERMKTFEQRYTAHKANVALHANVRATVKCDLHQVTGTTPPESLKERNRQHAQKSRQKRIQQIQSLTKERDESFVTLEHIVKYTTALESACSFLNDLNEHVSADLMEIRQKLFDRTCAHQNKKLQLESHLAFRATYRVNFK